MTHESFPIATECFATMAQRNNHYDAAFEEFLRNVRVPHVVVDETRRALLKGSSLKSMDFIVYSHRKPNLLVDINGRRFPSGSAGNRHKWENWTTSDDLSSLLEWQQVFGQDFRALLVFAYYVMDDCWLSEFETTFEFRQKTYAFFGVWADEYLADMRVRSASWDTVSLPSARFRELIAPIGTYL